MPEVDGQLATIIAFATLLSTTLLKMLEWWSQSRKEKVGAVASARLSDAQAERDYTAVEVQVQAVYGQIIADLKVDVAYVREQEKKCREDFQLLLKRVKVLEAAGKVRSVKTNKLANKQD